MRNFSLTILALAIVTATSSAYAGTISSDGTYTIGDTNEKWNVTNGATATIEGKNITGKQFSVVSKPESYVNHLILGTAETDSITIRNSENSFIVGLQAQGPGSANYDGSDMVVNSKLLDINLHSENDYVYGLSVGNNSTNKRDESGQLITEYTTSSVTINAETTVIKVTTAVAIDPNDLDHRAIAIANFSEGEVNINGNLYVDAATVLSTRGQAVTNINQSRDPSRIIQLRGDINFNYQNQTSGTPIDAIVNLNLMNADSFLRGQIVINGVGIPEGYDEVNAMNLGLVNGGAWIIAKDHDSNETWTQAAVNLELNGGRLRIEDPNYSVLVREMKGTGGTLEIGVEKTNDGYQHAVVNVASSDHTQRSYDVRYLGITADDVMNAQDTLDDLQEAITGKGKGEFSQTQIIDEGNIKGKITRILDADGKIIDGIHQAKNTKLDAFGSVSTLTALQWRHETTDLMKRMGDLRDNEGVVGSWVRIYGSEQEYGDQNIEAKNTSVQVGADYVVGNWKIGAAFNYTDGNSTYDYGEADNQNYGLGIYGTWIGLNGQFVDLVAKYTRLTNDFDLNGMSGDVDNNALSFSAEFGWRFQPCSFSFIEPQAELTYGRIFGETFHAKNGVMFDQDDFDTLVGRLGIRSGVISPDDKSQLYVRASILHDFQGEIDATASQGNASTKIHEDLGDTWFEFGIGAQFNLSNNAYTYIDLERSSGGDVRETWRWNTGLRYAF